MLGHSSRRFQRKNDFRVICFRNIARCIRAVKEFLQLFRGPLPADALSKRNAL